jgi:hypothetical protein
MICTTLNKIRAHSPCVKGWEKLLKHLGKTSADDEPLPLLTILESNGLDDCLWCLRSVPEHDREWRLFAVWCARQVQYLMTDPRSLAALDMAEKFANGQATYQTCLELEATWAAAREAAGAAAETAAREAAWAATWATAREAAEAAAGTATWATAWAAAWATAWAAAGEAQKTELIRIIS